MSRQNQTENEVVEEKSKNLAGEILEMLVYLAVVFAICAIVVTLVAQRTKVDGSSMQPSLSDGDQLIVNKFSYHFNDPERFDIVIFPDEKNPDIFYIKRVIGLPGETVWINGSGEIYINGVMLDENYGLETIANAGNAATPITLGDDEYFVLGDNRNNSLDSRFDKVGLVHRKKIVGKAWVRIYPFNAIGKVTHQ